MLHKKIKKIIPIICSLIIGLSGFTVSAASDDVVMSSSDITSVISSSDFTVPTSIPSYISKFINSGCYTFRFPSRVSSFNIPFDFNFSNIDISPYRNYNFNFPLVIGLISSDYEFYDLSLILRIEYLDGSVSDINVKSKLFEDFSSTVRPLYYCPLNFNITGNKLLNIKDSYFLVDCKYFNGNSNCYLAFKKDEFFTLNNYSPDYNTFFSSSLNWVSDIFKMVSDNFALVVLCVGFPLVAFAFLLLRRYIHS